MGGCQSAEKVTFGDFSKLSEIAETSSLACLSCSPTASPISSAVWQRSEAVGKVDFAGF
jgi:hypothetical protein